MYNSIIIMVIRTDIQSTKYHDIVYNYTHAKDFE